MAKVMNTEMLEAINRHAVKTERNRTLPQEFIERLDPEGIHIVGWSMLHNDVEVRARLLCKMKDSMIAMEVWLDMEIEIFNGLPEHTDLVETGSPDAVQES